MKELGKALKLCLLMALLLGFTNPAVGRLMSPRMKLYPSANKKFAVQIIPGPLGLKGSHLQIFAYSGGTNSIFWSLDHLNGDYPMSAYVSDDGESVVTLDEFPHPGTGDGVVVIYNRNGVVAHYSLEHFAPPPAPRKDVRGPRFGGIDPYQGMFGEGRPWRGGSTMIFHEAHGHLLFCIWLAWDERWVAWRMSDGGLESMKPGLKDQLNSRAFEISLKANLSEIPSRNSPAARFMDYARTQENRSKVASLLNSPSFTVNAKWVLDDLKAPDFAKQTFKEWRVASVDRAQADAVLQVWERPAGDLEELKTNVETKFLGAVQGAIHLNISPEPTNGILGIYLIQSQGAGANRGPTMGPMEAVAVGKMSEILINPFAPERGIVALPKSVPFTVKCINPGKYRVGAFWSKDSTNFSAPTNTDFRTEDILSKQAPEVMVVAGKEATGIDLELWKSNEKE